MSQPIRGCRLLRRPTHMPEHITPSPLALAVWPPASTSTHRDRYLSASRSEHRVAPELAARAILAYTDPGDLVIDPCCGVGTVLVEAIHHGRRAVGVEPNRRQAALATANISNARHQGAPGRAAVLEGNPEQLPRLLNKQPAILNPPHTGPTGRVRRHPAGSAQLILTASPARPTAELLCDLGRRRRPRRLPPARPPATTRQAPRQP